MVLTFSLISSVLVIVVGSVEYNSINKGYTFNSTCQNSFECRGKLICLELTCRCSVELIWNGTNCIMRQMAGMQCTSQIECQYDLHCVEGTCSCHETHYIKDKKCILRKQANELCNTSEECQSSLLCHRQICQCISSDYWNGTTCKLRKDYRSLCNATVQCKDTLTCFDEKCQCDKSNYWKGNVCIQKKNVDAACILSTDCKNNLKCSNGICVCNLDKAYWDGIACTNRPSECEDLNYTVDGVYPVYPGGNTKRTYVYCIKRDNTKWTVIQRRNDGTVNFYRALSEYTQGFGRADKEHWLGNMKIHRITQDETHELSIHLEDWNGNQRQANYSQFSVGSGNLYNLRVSGYSGNAGDSLTYHNGQSFYTKNRDNNSCAKKYRGAWWYRSCYHSNLNGKYNGTGNTGVVWNDFGGVSLKSSIMIIRRRDSLKYHQGKSFYTKSGCSQTWNEGDWWFDNCYYSNLNGKYNQTGETGFVWSGFGSGSLKASTMMIRRR